MEKNIENTYAGTVHTTNEVKNVCSKVPFMVGMAAGLVVGCTMGVMSQSRQVKTAKKKIMRSPAGRVVKSIADVIEQM